MSADLAIRQADLERSELGARALQLLDQGDLDAAAQLCDEGLRQQPADACLWTMRAAVLVRREKYPEALEALAHCQKANPANLSARLNVARVLLCAQRREEAVSLLRQCLELSPQSAEAHYLLAVALQDLADPRGFDECRRHFRTAAQLKPDWSQAHYYHATYSLRSSREAEAEEALRRALALRPDWADAHYQLAYALLEQDRAAEARAALEQVLRLEPGNQAARAWLAQLEPGRTTQAPQRLARYPRAAAEFLDLPKLLREYVLTEFPDPEPFLSAHTRVFTLGSCFAQNIAHGLRRYGIAAQHVEHAEDINSTYANRYFLDWIEGHENVQTRPFAQVLTETYRIQTAQSLTQADVVVISLGVAPCFFDRQTGAYASTLETNMHVALRLKHLEFRTTSVAENLANLREIIAAIRRLNANVRIVLTVSPVPLKATFERPSAIVADCISKSILRATAHELMQLKLERVIYWPSYEMVRWCGGHRGQVFGNDDGSPFHVAQELVAAIVDSFIRTFGDPQLVARVK